MEPSKRLASNLVAESKAYGYTLTIWGGGAILVAHYGTPSILAVAAYVGGALVAMALLAVVAFGGLLAEQRQPDGEPPPVASMVHIAATGGSLLVSYLVSIGGKGRLPPVLVFALVGFLATALYNTLLVAEDSIGRAVE
ncbi:hypothetical protein MUK72_08175 [Halococcus dombrowskii]|uniref:Uncharacterized protein n=1 Tax=Halococcus dombrowskii TaxID=179637 RepID=A0AAV3SGB7_HALDO|nr:hypothetical protein [Halococcus dombrowskii]UOO93948.1 hypothetical protein MUK72_08175 [Halococcus dombrowskii]